MDLEDFIVSNNILPLGSVIFVMFCVSKYGWGWKKFIKEADTGEGLKFPANVQKYMLYVIPAIVVVIYLKGYYDMFSPKTGCADCVDDCESAGVGTCRMDYIWEK